MSLTITFGWWIIPAFITLGGAVWATIISRSDEPDQYGIGSVIAVGFWMAAAIVSLISWLMWAVLT